MTKINVQMTIDSDLHPELYADVIKIGNLRHRGQRIRNLATNELVSRRAAPTTGAGPAAVPASHPAPESPASAHTTPPIVDKRETEQAVQQRNPVGDQQLDDLSVTKEVSESKQASSTDPEAATVVPGVSSDREAGLNLAMRMRSRGVFDRK